MILGDMCQRKNVSYKAEALFYLLIFIPAFVRYNTKGIWKQRVLILKSILPKSSVSNHAIHFQETFQQVTNVCIVFRELLVYVTKYSYGDNRYNLKYFNIHDNILKASLRHVFTHSDKLVNWWSDA